MSEYHELAAASQDESWARIERIVERFEDAWGKGKQPALSDYLREGTDLLPGLLVELIRAELEFRLQAGGAARVEEYLTRYPELADERQAVLALLQTEWRIRAPIEPQLSVEEYQKRFPALAQELTKVLCTVSLEAQQGLPTTLDMLRKDATGATRTELPRIPGYEIEKELGRGGMGVVWKARQLTLDRVVALKMILDDQHAGEEVLARFQREALVLARLHHPNIVQIHEVGTQNGRPFFSLEFVEGGSLDKKLQGKPCAIRQSARLVETLARAVQAAHEAGIVHRDLKPANVLVAKGWVLKITDFGLAKRLDEVGKTQTGAIMGTPSYMAPEQAAGKVREVGPASDVYALGAILYELLTGRPPFLAPTTWETIQKVLMEEPISLRRLRREIPHDLETICLKCLAKEPARRYRSALELAEDLDRLLAGEAIRARPEGWLRKQCRRAKRHRAALVTAMILALGLGVSSAVFWRYNQEQRVVRVQREFLAVLQENDGSPERLAELEDVLTRLEQLSPAQARASEQQWWESLEGIVRRNLAKPGKLQAEEAARMEDILRRLETRDPDRAKVLHEALDQRYRDWAVVLDLKPPFSERTPIFGETLDLQEANGALWRKLPSGGEKAFNPVVHTRIPCTGDLEFEAVFDSSWEKATSLGLYLNRIQEGGEILALAVAPDGQTVAVGNPQGAIELLDAENGKVRQVLRGHTGPVKALAFLPDGKQLLSGSDDKSVKLWGVSTGKARHTWIVAKSAFYGFALSPDGRSLATATDDSLVQLWEVEKPSAQARNFECKMGWYAGSTYGGLVFSPDCKALFGAADYATCCWEVATGKVRWFDTRTPSYLVALAISPDGARIALKSRQLVLRDATYGQSQETLSNDGSAGGCLAYSPDGRILARGLETGGIGLWASKTDQWLSPLEAYGRQPRLLVFLPGGSELLAAYEGGGLLRWDVTAQQAHTLRESAHYSVGIFAPVGEKPITFSEARKGGKAVRLCISRNGIIQCQRDVKLAGGSLRLLARREGDRIIFQVNEQPALVLHDVLPYRLHYGFFRLYWPAGVGLVQLHGRERPVPPAGSALERAEELFARGNFRGALPLYEEHCHNAVNMTVGQIGRRHADCKAALCLLHMNEVDTAIRRLQKTYGEDGTPGELWPALAGLTLWKTYIAQKRSAEVKALFESLAARYPHSVDSPLNALVTRSDQSKIIGFYMTDLVKDIEDQYATINTETVRRLERVLEVCKIMNYDLTDSYWQSKIIQAYHLTGQDQKARDAARSILSIAHSSYSIPHLHSVDTGWWMSELEYWGWLERCYGDPHHWLGTIDTELFSAPGVLRSLGPYRIQRLLIERCRTHWKLREWKEVENDLKLFFRFVEKKPPNDSGSLIYYSFATACLMQGFLCERRGDKSGAEATWKRGLYSAWWNNLPPDAQKEKNREPTLDWEDQTPYCMILGALCDTLTADETALKAITGGAWEGNIQQILKECLSVRDRVSVCREAWQSGLGRKFAFEIAIGDVVGAERHHCVPIPIWVAILHQQAMPGELLPEQQKILEELADKGWDAYCAGKLGAGGVQLLRRAWEGDTGYLGWESLSRRLEPKFRALAAYVLSYRYRRILNKPAEAKMLMETTLHDAVPDSPLHKLAKAELTQLKLPESGDK